MKQCPVCGRTYADDSLNFCLQDGVALSTASNAGPFDPDATLFDTSRTHQVGPPATDPPKWQPQTQHRGTLTERLESAPTIEGLSGGRHKNTALIVLLSVVGTLAVLALGGFGVWWLTMNDRKDRVAAGDKVVNETPSRNLNSSPAPAESPRITPTVPRPIAQPTAETAVNDPDVRQSVRNTINGWAAATRARDADTKMSFYADTIDPYYLRSNVSSSYVRAESQRAYSLFSTVDVQIDNMKIDVEPGGDAAVATFDKSWDFGGPRQSSGAVQQRLWFRRFGDRWLITGEKDLKVYYKNP